LPRRDRPDSSIGRALPAHYPKGIITMTKIILAIPALKFPLGQVVISANANAQLDPAEVTAALSRHASGDWGDVCADDAALNEQALKHGDRLLSVYGPKDRQFWIITEADRSVTTILMPEDY
jgi:hypothetical protein